jgi:hypothetical protein
MIIGVGSLSTIYDRSLELGLVHPTLVYVDLLQTCDFEALMLLEGMDELGGLKEGSMGAGIEPFVAAAEQFDIEVVNFKVIAV